MGFRFPFTNLSELNLDWVLSKVKELTDKTDKQLHDLTELEGKVDSAVYSVDHMTVDANTLQPGEDATATKSIINGHINIDFGIPKGEKGDPGQDGQDGAPGTPATDAQVQTAVNAWLTDNIDPDSGYALDRTLTLSTAAAPADIVGTFRDTVAPKFTVSANYSKGYYVYYNDILYKFLADHPAGAWTGTDVALVGVTNNVRKNAEDISDLKSQIMQLENDVIINEYGTWSQNRLMIQSGTNNLIEVASDTFCHSDFINTGANAVIEVADGYKVFAWDGAYSELGHQVYQVTSEWSTGTINYTYRTNYPYLAICVMKANSTNIVPSEAESAIKVYTSTTTPFALKTTVNELSNDVSGNTKDIFEIKSTLYPSTDFDYQLHNGKIVIANDAVTIQSDSTRAYTDYILMDNAHSAYLSVQSGYKYYAYLVDNDEGISKTYSPIAPFNAWMDTDQYINYDSTHPYLIVGIIKNPSGSITPEEAASALTIANRNIESVVGEINILKYQTMANVPSSGQILYNADTNQQSNHIVNAVAYDDGVIIGCRSDGKVVRIDYSGTEETLLTVDGSNCDWRLCWKDSNENVYVSPHASNGTLAMGDRGLYKLAKGGFSFTKVISLYNTNSSVPTEAQSNDDTIWTMCEDASGNLYAGVYAHTTRANPAIYKSTDGGNTWVYAYKFSSGMHIHAIIYSEWQNALYCIVGEINTIYKSTDGATTWNDLNVVLKSKGSAMCATPYGILIGSDSAYNCEIDILLNNDVTHQTVFSGWANTVFAIRRSDLTGIVYAFTKVDSAVNVADYYPPISAITDSSVLDTWKNTSGHNVALWTAYHDSVVGTYPDDAIRPQHCGILVSRDGGLHWDVLKRWELTNNGTTSTYVDGFWTTGFFKNGECLTGRLKTNTFVNPVVISEGKHKYVSGGCDLSGEIFVRINSSTTVEVL